MADTQAASDSILEAMEIVFAHEMESAGIDQTVPGIITGVQTANKYEVQMDGATYCVDNGTPLSFSVGDHVWVTIPKGNFQNKFISGSSAAIKTVQGGTAILFSEEEPPVVEGALWLKPIRD